MGTGCLRMKKVAICVVYVLYKIKKDWPTCFNIKHKKVYLRNKVNKTEYTRFKN